MAVTRRPLTQYEIDWYREQGIDPTNLVVEEEAGESLKKRSALGAGAISAAASAAPTAGAGAGFAGGAALGTMLGGGPETPVGWITGLGGGLIGAYLAGRGTSKIQEAVLPESAKQAIAESYQEHPTAATIGSLATLPLGGMNPSVALTRNAATGLGRMALGLERTALENASMKQAAAGAVIGGAQEAVMQPLEGREFDPKAIALNAAIAAGFNQPNKMIGQRLYGWHPITESALARPSAVEATLRAGQRAPAAATTRSPYVEMSTLDAIKRGFEQSGRRYPVEGKELRRTTKAETSASRIQELLKEGAEITPRESPEIQTELKKQKYYETKEWPYDLRHQETDLHSALETEVGNALKARKLPTTPTPQYVDLLTRELLNKHNIKVTLDGTLTNAEGKPIRGVSMLSKDVREVVVNPEKYTLDTLPHEDFHYFRTELEESASRGDAKAAQLLRTWDSLSKPGFDAVNQKRVAAGLEPIRDLHEFTVSEQGVEFVKQQLNLAGETAGRKWLNDTVALFRAKYSNAVTLPELRRALNFKLVNTATMGKYVGKTGPRGAVGAGGGTYAGGVRERMQDEGPVPESPFTPEEQKQGKAFQDALQASALRRIADAQESMGISDSAAQMREVEQAASYLGRLERNQELTPEEQQRIRKEGYDAINTVPGTTARELDKFHNIYNKTVKHAYDLQNVIPLKEDIGTHDTSDYKQALAALERERILRESIIDRNLERNQPGDTGLDRDIELYNKLNEERANILRSGKAIGPDGNFTPEFTDLWRRLEDVKNRHEGMPPTREQPPDTGLDIETIVVQAAKNTDTYKKWKLEAAKKGEDTSDAAFRIALTQDESIYADLVTEPEVQAAVQAASAPPPEKTLKHRETKAPVTKTVLSEQDKQDYEAAIRSRNIEPDGDIYISGNKVPATPENVAKSLEGINARIAYRERSIARLKELQISEPNADITRVKRLGYTEHIGGLEADTRLGTWAEALKENERALANTKQYMSDIKLAGRVYQAKQEAKPAYRTAGQKKQKPEAMIEPQKIYTGPPRTAVRNIEFPLGRGKVFYDKIEAVTNKEEASKMIRLLDNERIELDKRVKDEFSTLTIDERGLYADRISANRMLRDYLDNKFKVGAPASRYQDEGGLRQEELPLEKTGDFAALKKIASEPESPEARRLVKGAQDRLRTEAEIIGQRQQDETAGLQEGVHQTETGTTSLSYKYGFIRPLEATFDRVNQLSPTLANAFHRWRAYRENLIGLRNLAIDDLSSYDKQDVSRVAALHREAYRNGEQGVILTGQDAEISAILSDYYTKIGELRREMGLLIEGREAGLNPMYVPDMLNERVLDLFTNKATSPEAMAAKNEWIDYVVRESNGEISLEEATKNISEYIRALGGEKHHYTSVQFGAVRKAAGYGVPEALRETDAVNALHKYGQRAATDMAMFRELESKPEIAGPLLLKNPNTGEFHRGTDENSPIPQDTRIKDAMKWVTGGWSGTLSQSAPKLNATIRLVHNALLGTATGLRNVAQIPGFMVPYISRFSDLSAAMRGVVETRNNMRDSLAYAAKQPQIDKLMFNEALNAPDRFTAVTRKVATAFRKYQGAEAIENISRDVTFSIGKELTRNNILAARAGDAKAVNWLKRFGLLVDKDIMTLEGPELEAAINQTAKNFTDANQGTYSGSGLPAWTMDSQFAPFFALQKWSIEKSNIIYQDVVKPFMTGENRLPLLTYTLGTILSGAAIQALNELLTNRKGQDPTWQEAIDKADSKSIVAELATLMQLASFGGIVGDGLKFATDVGLRGKAPRNIVSFPTATAALNVEEKTRQMFEALNQGENPWNVLREYTIDLLIKQVQLARMVVNRTERAEDVERSGKYRDIRVFGELEGKPASAYTTANPYLNLGAKEFKRTGDIREAVGMIPELIQQQYEAAGGDFEKLSSRMRGLKANSYQTMPSPENMPMTFMNYYNFLARTQGPEVANARFQDYLQKRAVNKVKSSLIPNL